MVNDWCFIEAALGPSDGESAFETEISQDLSRMEGHLVSAPTATSRKVPMISVESLLARADVSDLVGAARPIVLSVDIEGPDLMVATRMLESGLRPHFIIFEAIRSSQQDLHVFERNGYEHLAKIGWNEMRRRPASTRPSSNGRRACWPQGPPRLRSNG